VRKPWLKIAMPVPSPLYYYGCEISNSEVEYSIILENCKVINAVGEKSSIIRQDDWTFKIDPKHNSA
jgi:hypothetical protein